MKIFCPSCDFPIEVTEEELYGEEYILCFCSNLFLNINYCKINKARRIITEENRRLF